MKIVEDIYWVGVVDWNIRDFHGYVTRFGTSYNAYLIKDEKVALIDTVKEDFKDQLLNRLEELGVEKLDYLIVNHIEMDHAGSVRAILEKYPEAKVVTNARGKAGLEQAYNVSHDTIVVKTGDKLSVGKRTLTFVETPMVHWPDSMVTYSIEDKILFSNDAFGMHYASSKLFDDELGEDLDKVFIEAAKYYANIVLPYSKQVQKVLPEVKKLEIKMICPSHGIIWRSNIEKILKRYEKWSKGESEARIVIAYDTMWKHTEKAVQEIVRGIEEVGVSYRIYRLKVSDFTEVITEVMLSKGLIVGSPTLNRELYPTVAAFLTYMKGLKPFGKVAAAFGSYGWSGEAVGKILQVFEELKFEVVGSVKFRFSHRGSEDELRKLGREVAEKVAEK